MLDASAVLAMLDADESAHAACVRAATSLARLRCRQFQTTYLRVETHALLLARLGDDAARRWLAEPPPATIHPERVDEARAEEIILRHRDKDYSLCDTISFAVMRRLRVRVAFTLDRHFRQFGFETMP